MNFLSTIFVCLIVAGNNPGMVAQNWRIADYNMQRGPALSNAEYHLMLRDLHQARPKDRPHLRFAFAKNGPLDHEHFVTYVDDGREEEHVLRTLDMLYFPVTNRYGFAKSRPAIIYSSSSLTHWRFAEHNTASTPYLDPIEIAMLHEAWAATAACDRHRLNYAYGFFGGLGHEHLVIYLESDIPGSMLVFGTNLYYDPFSGSLTPFPGGFAWDPAPCQD